MLPTIETVDEPLSEIPSVAIRQALDDLQAAERAGVKIDMGVWLKQNGECQACLAGSVMLRRPDAFAASIPQLHEFIPNDSSIGGRLIGLNSFRQGFVEDGCGDFGASLPENMEPYRTIPQYAEDRNGFIAAMSQLADDLEAAGL